MRTFSEEIRELAERAEKPSVKAMLKHAAIQEDSLPEYRAAKVRMRDKNCLGCKDGVVFQGTERVTPSD